jgi:hypothetical protein
MEGLSLMSIEFQAFWEAGIGVLLIGTGVPIASNSYRQITEIYMFATVQSLAVPSAVAISSGAQRRANGLPTPAVPRKPYRPRYTGRPTEEAPRTP